MEKMTKKFTGSINGTIYTSEEEYNKAYDELLKTNPSHLNTWTSTYFDSSDGYFDGTSITTSSTWSNEDCCKEKQNNCYESAVLNDNGPGCKLDESKSFLTELTNGFNRLFRSVDCTTIDIDSFMKRMEDFLFEMKKFSVQYICDKCNPNDTAYWGSKRSDILMERLLTARRMKEQLQAYKKFMDVEMADSDRAKESIRNDRECLSNMNADIQDLKNKIDELGTELHQLKCRLRYLYVDRDNLKTKIDNKIEKEGYRIDKYDEQLYIDNKIKDQYSNIVSKLDSFFSNIITNLICNIKEEKMIEEHRDEQ